MSYEHGFLYIHCDQSDLLEDITRCGQTIQIMYAPEVGPMRSYQKNQQLVPNTVGTGARCLHICNMEYQDFKFDAIDLEQIVNRYL